MSWMKTARCDWCGKFSRPASTAAKVREMNPKWILGSPQNGGTDACREEHRDYHRMYGMSLQGAMEFEKDIYTRYVNRVHIGEPVNLKTMPWMVTSPNIFPDLYPGVTRSLQLMFERDGEWQPLADMSRKEKLLQMLAEHWESDVVESI